MRVNLTRGYWFDTITGMLCLKGSFPVEPDRHNLLKGEWASYLNNALKEESSEKLSKRDREEIEIVLNKWRKQ